MENKSFLYYIILLFLIIALFSVLLGVVTLMTWGFCMCFGIEFQFLYGVGVFIVILAINFFLRNGNNN